MSNLVKFIYEKVWAIFSISYWIQLYDDYPYSKSFDAWCRKSLDKGCQIKRIDRFTVEFNGRILWIGNEKVACFHLYEVGKPSAAPSRYTKHLMMKRFNDSWEIVNERK